MQLEIIIKLIYIDLSLYKLLITLDHYINSYKPTLMFSMLCNTPASPHPPPGASPRGSAGAGPAPRLRLPTLQRPLSFPRRRPEGTSGLQRSRGRDAGRLITKINPPQKATSRWLAARRKGPAPELLWNLSRLCPAPLGRQRAVRGSKDFFCSKRKIPAMIKPLSAGGDQMISENNLPFDNISFKMNAGLDWRGMNSIICTI